MEKENKRYGPKEYTYNLGNYHLYEKKKKHEKQCIPLPTRRERGLLTKLL